MKTILKICVFMLSFSFYAQVTSIAPMGDLFFEHSNGVYLKDLNHELDFIEGTWEAISNNKRYIFEFTVFTQYLDIYPNGEYFYQDKLRAKFKVIDLSNNQVLYDNLNATNYEDHKILKLTIWDEVEFEFAYIDTEDNCYNTVYFNIIKNPSNLNQITYKKFKMGDYGGLTPCNYNTQEDIPMFLPTQELILTKQ